jgi:hypothetical protein
MKALFEIGLGRLVLGLQWDRITEDYDTTRDGFRAAPLPPSPLRAGITARPTTWIDSTSSLNGAGFLSLNMNPKALTSFGSTGPVSFTTRPNEVATNASSETLTSIHSSFFV